MTKRVLLWLLKLIGVGLFFWIVAQLDRAALLHNISHANPWLLLASFPCVFVIYAIKTWRWHLLIRTTGSNLPLSYTWQVFNLGVFLATITPGKLGELGRAAYLEQTGMKRMLAIALSIIDRLADVVVVAMLSVAAIGLLFGVPPLLLALAGIVIGLWFFWWFMSRRFVQKLLPFLPYFQEVNVIWKTLALTTGSWGVYYVWTTLIARSIGIDVPPIHLAAVTTIAGIVAVMPIAPSGFGTRDAALAVLLGIYGVAPESAIAMALLMFVSIMLSGILGLVYWVKGVEPVHYNHDQVVDTQGRSGPLGLKP